ncbi:MAG: hypothetical protein QG552_1392, partial [Thermodesulfobacteriota bacterium]|nr:hypothetical protein [Thermodesulfobacteriota bacterium]
SDDGHAQGLTRLFSTDKRDRITTIGI